MGRRLKYAPLWDIWQLLMKRQTKTRMRWYITISHGGWGGWTNKWQTYDEQTTASSRGWRWGGRITTGMRQLDTHIWTQWKIGHGGSPQVSLPPMMKEELWLPLRWKNETQGWIPWPSLPHEAAWTFGSTTPAWFTCLSLQVSPNQLASYTVGRIRSHRAALTRRNERLMGKGPGRALRGMQCPPLHPMLEIVPLRKGPCTTHYNNSGQKVVVGIVIYGY